MSLMKIAINTKIDYKPKQGDLVAYSSLATDFENVSLSAAELAVHISLGHSFCAQHANGRKSANFTVAGFIAVDIDNGLTLAEALSNNWVANHAAIVYTTWSHTDANNRFRIVFELEREIEDAGQMKSAYQGLIRKFGGDTSCKDACRIFFGAKGSAVKVIGKTLPSEMLDELIESGKAKKLSAETGDETALNSSAYRSARSLSKDHLVLTSNGFMEQVSHLARKSSVHCPFHIDKNPSAFIVESRKHIKGVHCSKCGETFWPSALTRRHLQDFDFYSIDGILNEIEYEEDPMNSYSEEDPQEFITDAGRVVKSGNSARLTNIDMVDGTIHVRSPKGTGKSFQLKRLVDQCKGRGLSVLLIGHRQSLISALASDLGLTSYLEKEDEWGERTGVTSYYAICLDSIPRLLDLKRNLFDVIIIDESEQVFSHLTADTLKKQRRDCFLKMERYIKQARTVIACDADLSYLTMDVISRARNGELPNRIYVNRHKQVGRSVSLYKSHNHLVSELIKAVGSGGRYYVCCNSKKRADEITYLILSTATREIKVQLITKDNSQQPEVRKFIKNIKTEILDFDVIVSSPSLGTGIDISFTDGAQLVDGVFGFFNTRINTHFDIDQQLSRVRNPGFVKAWISPEKYAFEIEPDAIKQALTEAGAFTDFLIKYDENNEKIYPDDDAIMLLHAEVLALGRASKNNLKKHFIDLRKYNGWTVDEIDVEDDLAAEGGIATKRAKDDIRRAENDELCAAEKITASHAKSLQEQASPSGTVQMKLKRYRIESFYEQNISPELVDLDDAGKLRAKVRLLATLIGDDDYSMRRDAREKSNFAGDKQHHYSRKILLKTVLTAAELLDESGNFDFEKKFENNTLNRFVEVCLESKAQIENLLQVEIRSDIHKKPISQLGAFLRMMGLVWRKPMKTDVGGKRTIYYSLDEGRHNLVREYALKYIARDYSTSHVDTEGSNGSGRPKQKKLK